MNLLVIGNGFDLAHHLPTQYSDFLDFVNAFIKSDGSVYSRFISQLMSTNDRLYLEIEALIKDNILIEYFLSIYKERCKAGKKGWIDFENEVAEIVQNLDEAKQYVEKEYATTNEPVTLEKGLARKLMPIIKNKKEIPADAYVSPSQYEPRFFEYQSRRILDALNRLTRLLEIYLYEYVEKQECSYRLCDFEEFGIDHVLSFNYTDTYRKYYDPEEKAKYCYIHGRVKEGNTETCDLVLGINEYLSSDRMDSDNQFLWFKKFYQRIYKETGSEYLDWMDSFVENNKACAKLNPVHTNIYIYGHSLDVTDKDVLSKLILLENSTTHIFYHNKDAMAKQISNIVKVIGEEMLVKMTGGKDSRIRFIKALDAVKSH